MLIPIGPWSIKSEDEMELPESYVESVKCPMEEKKKRKGGQPCVCYLGRCEYFHHADSKGIECIYYEVETDVIDGQTIDDEE